MSSPTFVLRHWHDDCASNNLTLVDQIEGMETNSIKDLYSDFRSPSRGQRQHLRKRHPVLNPVFRKTPRHRDCPCSSCRAISTRQRHRKRARSECTDEAYWDKELAELEHRERMESLDLVTLYYSHGHNAEILEHLRPKPLDCESKYEELLEMDTQKRLAISDNTNAWSVMKAITTHHWTLTLSTPLSSIPDSATQDPDTPTIPAWKDETFTYHLNPTGLWELGHGPRYTPLDQITPDPYGCTTHPLALNCGCCCLPCSCASIPSWWRDPEESWRGSIVELMSGGMYEGMRFADILHECRMEYEGKRRGAVAVVPGSEGGGEGKYDWGNDAGEWTVVRALRGGRDEEWDLISELSSTGSWRVVDVS